MASSQILSGSVRKKGQTALICELCENNPKIKWKCLDCKLLICQRCRDKVHPKFASSEDHKIIDIKEIGKHETDSVTKPDLARIKCGVHSGQNCCLYCKTCDSLVCQTCVAKTHVQHTFSEIMEGYQTKSEKIKSHQKEMISVIQNLTVEEKRLEQMRFNEQSKYDKVKEEIIKYDKALVNEVKKHTNKLLQDLDQKWKTLSNSIDNELKTLKQNQSQIQEQMRKMNDSLQLNNATDLFSFSDYFSRPPKTDFTLTNDSFQGISQFTHGDKAKLPMVLGKLEDASVHIDYELHVETTFKTDLADITTVVFCSQGFLWMCDSDEIVYKVQQYGDNLNVISTFEIDVADAALLPSGDLLLSVAKSSNIKLIPSGSTDIRDSVYTVSPTYPTCVHVSCDNKVIVGAVDSGVICAKGPRQVIVMDHTGCNEKVFQYDRHGKPLFTFPYRVTSNSKGNIVVVDWVSNDYRGRVVVLSLEEGIANIYTGHPDINNEDNPFEPTGITTTTSDKFIVADKTSNILHILNSEGDIITFCNTEKMGILLPYSLSFSTTGQYFIGCGTYEDSEERAKLFKINNFLC